MKCYECGKAEMKDTKAEERLEVGGLAFVAELPASRCPACKATAIDGPSLERFERAAELLDVTPETVSKWENGKLPVPIPETSTVAALVLDRLTGRDDTAVRLAHLRKPPKRAPVRLSPDDLAAVASG
jgi:hypothetical protein